VHPLAIPIWEKKIESTWNLRNKKKTREKLLIVLPSSNVLSFSFFLLTLSFLSYSSLMPIQLKVNTHIYFSFVFYAVFILISRDLIINRIIFLLEVYTHTHIHSIKDMSSISKRNLCSENVMKGKQDLYT